MPRHLPSIAKAPRLRVLCHDAHLFTAPARRVQSPVQVESEQMLVMLSGTYSATWTHARRSGHVEASAGDVVLWPPHYLRMETNDPQRPMRCAILYLRWDNPIPNLPFVRHDDHRIIRALSDRLMQLTETRTPRQQSLLNTYAAAMLAEYVHLCGDATGDGDLIDRVGLYVRANLRKRLTLDHLSRHVGLEKHYFGRRYKHLTGRTPMQAVRRLRIDRAVALIRSAPGIPLKSVADRVGIANGNLLSRWIKKELNLTATDIRR